jgi:hypothetical protein
MHVLIPLWLLTTSSVALVLRRERPRDFGSTRNAASAETSVVRVAQGTADAEHVRRCYVDARRDDDQMLERFRTRTFRIT